MQFKPPRLWHFVKAALAHQDQIAGVPDSSIQQPWIDSYRNFGKSHEQDGALQVAQW